MTQSMQANQPSLYTPEFYENQRDSSKRAATVVLEILYRYIQPKSVIDLGCGTGAWLSVFQEHYGVADFLGVDGDYVDRDLLYIPNDQFQTFNLSQPYSNPRRFDMAMSLEVAEHLPASHAPLFVKNLTQLAPIVLFSAATPHQGGVGHINEQWQNYWAELFVVEGYQPIDLFRHYTWSNPNVSWWYSQNLLLYAHESILSENQALNFEAKRTNIGGLDIVHPANFRRFVETPQWKPGQLFKKALKTLSLIPQSLRN
ncbi:MAG: class I SAM-dependent methyltransferase [Cyanobacteria bacterium]|nr:class I SAM-dependent methyltransferase [Cyanobacteriota bacterium]